MKNMRQGDLFGHLRSAVAGVCIAVSLLLPTWSAAQPASRYEAKAQLVALARAGKIEEIEQTVLAAQQAFERDPAQIERMGGLLDGIEDKRLPFYAIEAQLNRWVERAPQSYAALLLRGHYLQVAASRARGRAWARLTSEEQFAKMRELYERSRVDLLAAAQLSRVPLHARVSMIWSALIAGQRSHMRGQYDLAMAQSPGNLKLRQAWMASLEPRWGGSYDAMEAYARESASALAPQHAAKLSAAMAFDAASMLRSNRQYDAAEKKYSEALRISDEPFIRAWRADSLARLGRSKEAIEELHIAFKHADFHRAGAASALGVLERANPQDAVIHQMMDAVLEHFPDETDLLGLRGFRLQQSGNLARAYLDFRASAETGDAWAETMVGKYIFNGLGGLPVNREEGLVWLKRAAAKGEPNAQLSVTQALEAMGRKNEVAAVQAEFQQVNQKIASKKNPQGARDMSDDPWGYFVDAARILWTVIRQSLFGR